MLVNVGLAAASLAVGLLVVEGIARLVLSRRDEGKEGRELSRHMEYDPHLGWRHRPGARTMYRRREYATEVAFNGHGLRNPERDYEARPGTFRVLALGDSFVEGYTVPYEQTVTHVMETGVGRPAFASRCSTPVPPAYSTDQEYPYYREEVFADCRARLLLLQRRPRQPDRKLLRLAQATPRAVDGRMGAEERSLAAAAAACSAHGTPRASAEGIGGHPVGERSPGPRRPSRL